MQVKTCAEGGCCRFFADQIVTQQCVMKLEEAAVGASNVVGGAQLISYGVVALLVAVFACLGGVGTLTSKPPVPVEATVLEACVPGPDDFRVTRNGSVRRVKGFCTLRVSYTTPAGEVVSASLPAYEMFAKGQVVTLELPDAEDPRRVRFPSSLSSGASASLMFLCALVMLGSGIACLAASRNEKARHAFTLFSAVS